MFKHGDLIALKDEKVFIGWLTIVNKIFVIGREDGAISKNRNQAEILGRAVRFVGSTNNDIEKPHTP